MMSAALADKLNPNVVLKQERVPRAYAQVFNAAFRIKDILEQWLTRYNKHDTENPRTKYKGLKGSPLAACTRL
jgi:hypothetical protein